MVKEKIKQIYSDLLFNAGITINGDRPWDIKIINDTSFLYFLKGSLGMGESYMEGLWECEKVDEMMFRFLKASIDSKTMRIDKLFANLAGRMLNLQTKKRSQKVAEIHYDLGNDFYASMLDPYMQYTCGYWANAQNLKEAQEQKLDLVCRKLQLKPEDEVLELGCGWGGFAKFAAEKYGCHITAVNISREQVEFARQQCKKLPVTIVHSDYRDIKGTYDKVVSIGMLEHVGYKNYTSFFSQIHTNLKQGSITLVHTIGNNVTTVSTDPWLEKYIFPGSKLPSLQQISQASEVCFIIEDLHNLSVDYDKTLMAWYDNFIEGWPHYEKKYGDRFFRMWSYYLLLCAAIFRARKAQLWQIVFSHGTLEGGYQSIR